MYRLLLGLLTCIALTTATYGQTPVFLLFGAENHKTYLGCLNCTKYEAGSVCNKYGEQGSKYNSDSIWNPYGGFGSKYSDDSPWNQYSSSGPVIVDSAGHFYGRFTANKHASGRTQIKVLNQLADIVANGADLDAARNLFCGE